MSDQSASSPVIRTMAPSDLDRIIEIDVKVLGKQRPEYWEMKLDLVGKRAQLSSLVAELDSKVIGFIIGGVSKWEYGMPENIGWIDTIGVDPVYQRKGVAKMLFVEITNNLKKLGIDTIITFVTRRDTMLLNFFKSLGL